MSDTSITVIYNGLSLTVLYLVKIIPETCSAH